MKQPFEVISTPKAPAAIGPYSQATRVGALLFCSGQIALDPSSGELIEGDVKVQTHRVLQNLAAVLDEAGGSLKNIVKTTIFLKNMSDFNQVNEVYGEYFLAPWPARATIEVAQLPKNVDVEIEAIANLDPA